MSTDANKADGALDSPLDLAQRAERLARAFDQRLEAESRHSWDRPLDDDTLFELAGAFAEMHQAWSHAITAYTSEIHKATQFRTPGAMRLLLTAAGEPGLVAEADPLTATVQRLDSIHTLCVKSWTPFSNLWGLKTFQRAEELGRRVAQLEEEIRRLTPASGQFTQSATTAPRRPAAKGSLPLPPSSP